MVLFDNPMECDEEGIVFYPNGDISRGELEKILDRAHKKRHQDNKQVKCYERVRLSRSQAETPTYGRKVVKISLGKLKEIYGRSYGPNEIVSFPAVLAMIGGELYDLGS